jgi:hypothetical protein
MTASYNWKQNIAGRESQAAWRQDELNGSKPSGVKWLRLWLSLNHRVEEGSNISNVALRVVGCDERDRLGTWLGHPVPEEYKYRDLAIQVGGVSSLRQWNMVISSAGFGLENDCAGDDQQLLYITEPSSRQRGCYIRTMTARVQLKNLLLLVSRGLATRRTDLW